MVFVFTLTVFLSAFLLFSVQPMIAKTLLPAFGGGSSVWTTCMLFYQTLLLLGYLYAHVLLTRFSRTAQLLIHGALLIAALIVGIMFDTPQGPPEASTFPVPWLIGQLLVVSGLPFFAISSAGPLIQGWFARTGHARAHDPYFLYAASNAGSLIGLLAYPLLFEPGLGLAAQREYWLVLFGVFIVQALFAVGQTRKPVSETKKQAKRRRKAEARAAGGDQAEMLAGEVITWRRRLWWMYLAFIPSSILLGVTTFITTDVVSLPMLWVLPLALYLITMIIAFGTHAKRAVKDFTRPMVILVLGAMVLIMATELKAEGSMAMIVAVELLVMLAIGIVCHGKLALDRPAATHLTEFYLLMSLGGALGGLFNGIFAPLVFNTNLEYPIALVLAVSVLPWSKDLAGMGVQRARRIRLTRRVALPLISLAYLLVMARYGEGISGWIHHLVRGEEMAQAPVNMTLVAMLISVPTLLVYLAWKDGLACALTLLLPMLAVQHNLSSDSDILYRARTFYGVHEVSEQVLDDRVNDRLVPIHVIHHGTTVHGIQYMDPQLELQPLGYYHFNGPCGKIMAALKSMRPNGARIGIMGLGSGAISAHGRAQDEITFFEIDPEVEKIARDPRLFTFLEKAPADIEVRLGDARKLIEESEARGEEKFDLLHADAFSSDSIPTHLLTVEAVNLYLERLTDDGMLVLHISNRYLDLGPLVYELAMATTGIPPLILVDNGITPEEENYRFPSIWMVIIKDPMTGIRIGEAAKSPTGNDDENMAVLYGMDESERVRVWTDDYSNILSLIKWTQ